MITENLMWSAIDRIRDEQIRQSEALRRILRAQQEILIALNRPTPPKSQERGWKDALRAALDPDKAITAKLLMFGLIAVYILRGGDLGKLLTVMLSL